MKKTHNKRVSTVNTEETLKLQLVPELVGKRIYENGKSNPNYICAGSLYIPKDIVAWISNGQNFSLTQGSSLNDPVFNEQSDNEDKQQITVEDPELKKYIDRIVRYSKFDPKEALTTVREASYEIKNRARSSKRRVSSSSRTEIQAYNSVMKSNDEDSDSSDGFLAPNKELPIQSEDNEGGVSKVAPKKKLLQKVISSFKGSKKGWSRQKVDTVKSTGLEAEPGTSGYSCKETNAYDNTWEEEKTAGKRKG